MRMSLRKIMCLAKFVIIWMLWAPASTNFLFAVYTTNASEKDSIFNCEHMLEGDKIAFFGRYSHILEYTESSVDPGPPFRIPEISIVFRGMIVDKDRVILAGDGGAVVMNVTNPAKPIVDVTNDHTEMGNGIKNTELVIVSGFSTKKVTIYNSLTAAQVTQSPGNVGEEARSSLQWKDTVFFLISVKDTNMYSVDYTNCQHAALIGGSGYQIITKVRAGRTEAGFIYSTDKSHLIEVDFDPPAVTNIVQFSTGIVYQFLLLPGTSFALGDEFSLRKFFLVDLDVGASSVRWQVDNEGRTVCLDKTARFAIGTKRDDFPFFLFSFEIPDLSCNVQDCGECALKDDFCSKCENGKYLENGKCVSECADNLQYFPETNKCLDTFCENENAQFLDSQAYCLHCAKDCRKCHGLDKCVRCEEGFDLHEDGSCQAPPSAPKELPADLEVKDETEPKPGMGIDRATRKATPCLESGCQDCSSDYRVCKDAQRNPSFLEKTFNFKGFAENWIVPLAEAGSYIFAIGLTPFGVLLQRFSLSQNDPPVVKLYDVDLGSEANENLRELRGGILMVASDTEREMNDSKRVESRMGFYEVPVRFTSHWRIMVRYLIFLILAFSELLRRFLLWRIKNTDPKDEDRELGSSVLKFVQFATKFNFSIFQTVYPYILFYSARFEVWQDKKAGGDTLVYLFIMRAVLALTIWLFVSHLVQAFWFQESLWRKRQFEESKTSIIKTKVQPVQPGKDKTNLAINKDKKIEKGQDDDEEEEESSEDSIDWEEIDIKRTYIGLKGYNLNLHKYLRCILTQKGLGSKYGRLGAFWLQARIFLHILVAMYLSWSSIIWVGLVSSILYELLLIVSGLVFLVKRYWRNPIEFIHILLTSVPLLGIFSLQLVFHRQESPSRSSQEYLSILFLFLGFFEYIVLVLRIIQVFLIFRSVQSEVRNKLVVAKGEYMQDSTLKAKQIETITKKNVELAEMRKYEFLTPNSEEPLNSGKLEIGNLSVEEAKRKSLNKLSNTGKRLSKENLEKEVPEDKKIEQDQKVDELESLKLKPKTSQIKRKGTSKRNSRFKTTKNFVRTKNGSDF